MLFADLLSLHLVTLLMFFILVVQVLQHFQWQQQFLPHDELHSCPV